MRRTAPPGEERHDELSPSDGTKPSFLGLHWKLSPSYTPVSAPGSLVSPKPARQLVSTAETNPAGHRRMADDRCRIGTRVREYDLAAPVMLSRDDRRRHIHIIGKTGVGKTSLLSALIFDDLANGRDFALLDPLGGLAEAIVDAVPAWRNDSTIYWNPGADLEHVIAFNPLDRVPPDRRALIAGHVTDAFNHIWGGDLEKTPRMIYVLTNALRLLLDAPGSTLLGLPRLLVDDDYRACLLRTCEDPLVRAFWQDEFLAYGDRFRAEVVSPVQNKIGLLLGVPMLRNILSQPHSTIDIARLMNERGSLIVNLAKGNMGSTGTHLLGALIATTIAQVAEGRAAIAPDKRRDFTLYCDEVHNFATSAFANMYAESRNWRLAVCSGHQYLRQLPDTVREAVIGNCGSLIAFRIGADDAKVIAAEFDIEPPNTLSNTRNFTAWARILENGQPSEAFLLHTELIAPPAEGRKAAVAAHTRARHCRCRAAVERSILQQLDRREA